MDGYLQIALIITIASIISGYVGNRESKIERMLQHAVFYFGVLSALRSWQGNRFVMLGQSFSQKTIVGYGKAIAVVVFVGVLFVIAGYINNDYIKKWIKNTAIAFYAIHILTIASYTVPNNPLNAYEFFLSVIIGSIMSLAKYKIRADVGEKAELLTISIVAYLMLFLISGPTEIFAFNKNDYSFVFKEYIGFIAVYALFYIILSWLIGKYVFNEAINVVISSIILMITVLAYIQTMFLNGSMQELQGQKNVWDNKIIISNTLLWLILAIGIGIGLYVSFRRELLYKVVVWVSIIVIILQSSAFIGSIIQGNVWQQNPRRATKEMIYELGTQENIIILLLDSYGTDVVDYVQQSDPTFFEPLKDFTYYNNVKGEFRITNPTVHMFLTGHKESVKEEHYKNCTFLQDIKTYGYYTSLYSDAFLMTPYLDDLVMNLGQDPVRFDSGRLVNMMMRSAKFRGAPFIIKNYFEYTSIDFLNTIDYTNIVDFRGDREFYLGLKNEGISVNKDIEKRLVLYHLVGAHMPFTLRENMEYDFSSEDPLAQSRASMNIAYEYLNQLKANGLYNESTIIIMADHGPKAELKDKIIDAGLGEVDDNKPIMFIKRVDETHDNVVINDNVVTNERFQGTIMKLIDPDNANYGKAVWE